MFDDENPSVIRALFVLSVVGLFAAPFFATGCDDSDDSGDTSSEATTTETTLTYRVDFEEAYEKQMHHNGLIIVEKLETGGAVGDVAVADDQAGPESVEIQLTDERDAELLREVVENEFRLLEVGDQTPDGLRIERNDVAVDVVRPQLLRATVQSARTALEAEGFTDAQVESRLPDQIIATVLANGDSDVERARRALRDRDRLRFARVDRDIGDSLFERLADDAPEGMELRQWRGHNTLTHPDLETLRDFLEGNTPEETEPVYQFAPADSDGRPAYWRSYLVRDEAPLSGRHLLDVTVEIDDPSRDPGVGIDFTEEGAELLEEYTREHQGELVAILIGDRVQSVPLISEPVPDGRLRITLGGLMSYTELQQESQVIADTVWGQTLPTSLELISTDRSPR